MLIASGRRLAELSDKLAELSEKIEKQSESLHRRLEEVRAEVLNDAKAGSLLGERTYDLFHSDSELTRSVSGKVFNRDKPCANPAFVELMKHATNDQIEDVVWHGILAEALVEAAAVSGAAQVFERHAYINDYLAQLARTFRAKYGAGWVNMNDALFLYWLVRQTRPRRILQCGAFNGLSSAFMMLALAKNGPDGRLGIIDQPTVFDSQDPKWRIEGKAYGAVVPEGKCSAWMVPDQYADRFNLSTGDVGSLLPKAIDSVDGIDFFYYAADHTYRGMMSAFESAKRKLRPN